MWILGMCGQPGVESGEKAVAAPLKHKRLALPLRFFFFFSPYFTFCQLVSSKMAQSKVDVSPLESVGQYELPSSFCIGLLMLTTICLGLCPTKPKRATRYSTSTSMQMSRHSECNPEFSRLLLRHRRGSRVLTVYVYADGDTELKTLSRIFLAPCSCPMSTSLPWKRT